MKNFFFLSVVLTLVEYTLQSVLHGKMNIKHVPVNLAPCCDKIHPCECWKLLFCEPQCQEHFSQMDICV